MSNLYNLVGKINFQCVNRWLGSPPEGFHHVITSTHVSTESKIDLKDTLIQHGTMTANDFDFKGKEFKITNGILSDAIKKNA